MHGRFCSQIHTSTTVLQPLVEVALAGIRFSRSITDNSNSTQATSLCLSKNTFVSLDSIELTDLLRQRTSPFRVLATSSQQDQPKQIGLFSFITQIELEAMAWQSHQISASEWGFKMSLSMEKRHDAIFQLTRPRDCFDKPSGEQHFVTFNSALYESGLSCIDINVQHLTAQWNPSSIIALQRFLGRLKKAALSILQKGKVTKVNVPSNAPKTAETHSRREAISCDVIFSVNAKFGSICLCLSECIPSFYEGLVKLSCLDAIPPTILFALYPQTKNINRGVCWMCL